MSEAKSTAWHHTVDNSAMTLKRQQDLITALREYTQLLGAALYDGPAAVRGQSILQHSKEVRAKITRAEEALRDAAAVNDDFPFPHIAEEMARRGMTDCDAFIAWSLGCAALEASRRIGAKFPSDTCA